MIVVEKRYEICYCVKETEPKLSRASEYLIGYSFFYQLVTTLVDPYVPSHVTIGFFMFLNLDLVLTLDRPAWPPLSFRTGIWSDEIVPTPEQHLCWHLAIVTSR